ncbi:hypothetical protein SAMN05444272_2962 [Roseibium suaedae]|uniref:Uncharacterized protein n=2 Tax=Roseibium suaedae TaxID=735517 RepID=A0A1M7KSF4_9HYPH|nr:hypothetical protein SAMN05444272_2962 [Roseibium suaedae]
MKRLFVFTCFGALLAPLANAETSMPLDEFSIVSRDTAGNFVGSHKIFKRKAAGMKQVIYCEEKYWVRPYTVAWTQTEVENKRIVRVEYSAGKGWRPICANPQTQVTLNDFGIKQDASEVMYFGGFNGASEGVFDSMKRGFSTPKADEKPAGSYHTN